MKKLLKKTGKTLLIVICALMLYAVICTMFVDHMTYFPLSGRIFNIDPDEVDSIAIRYSGPNGVREFTSDQEKAKIVNYLNGLRYHFWIPLPDLGFAGWTYAITVEEDGKTYWYEMGDDTLEAKGILYFVPEEDLEYLKSLDPHYPR